MGRVLAAVGLVLAAVSAAMLLTGGGGTYDVRAVVQNAGQLVEGNQVKVGGVVVGEVTDIELDDRNRASLTLTLTEDRFTPLHEGTRASIRGTSLSSVAGRIVTLAPGPSNAPAIPEGGAIPMEATDPIVDLDQVLNTLDVETRAALQGAVHGLGTSYAKDVRLANRGLRALNPAVSQARELTAELLRDRDAFEDLLTESADVVSAVASQDDALASGVARAAATAGAVADESAALDRTLRSTPRTLRRANTTLANLRAALGDLRPALRDTRPAAPRLARVLEVLAPLSRRARPVVADVRTALPDLDRALRGLPSLERTGRPAVAAATEALDGTADLLPAVRAYTPDIVAGFLNGFGGTAGASYDANGHYARISLQGNATAITGLGSLLPTPTPGPDASGGVDGLTAFRTGVVARCPGAATQPAQDGSNPWRPDDVDCRLTDSPR